MQNQDYIIKVRGRQIIEDDSDTIELTVHGSYEEKDGHKIIKYREYTGDDINEYTDTTVDIDKNSVVTVKKQGVDTSLMILEKDKRHQSQYETPLGSIIMGVNTIGVINRLSKSGGVLKVKYQVDFFSNYTTDNILEIIVKKIKD